MYELKYQSDKREDLIDITQDIENIIREADIGAGLCNIYVPHATSGVIINENDDPEIIKDIHDVLRRVVPRGSTRHDRLDGNGDSHVKSAFTGPSETIPFRKKKLLLGTWQSIMLCEFDGPKERKVIVTLMNI